MFGGNKNTQVEKVEKKSGVATVIAPECTIKGSLITNGMTRVDGTIEGDLHVDGDLVIGENATVKANVIGKSILIAGQVNGDVTAHKSLELAPTAKLTGNIRAGSFSVAPGATFIGSSLALEEEKEKTFDTSYTYDLGFKEAAAATEDQE